MLPLLSKGQALAWAFVFGTLAWLFLLPPVANYLCLYLFLAIAFGFGFIAYLKFERDRRIVRSHRRKE